MTRVALTLLLPMIALAAPAAPPVAGPAADPFAPLRPLLGEWAGDSSGSPGDFVAWRASFAFDLGGKVLVRRSHGVRGGGEVHDDLLFIWSTQGGGLYATYLDNQGQATQYGVVVDGARVIFKQGGYVPGRREQLEYAPLADGGYAITRSIGVPGERFVPIWAGTMHRGKR